VFAGAAREAVFSKPEVIRRINAGFIPVALKAALVNNPPPGLEGRLYAEIGRSKPAPQGICVANSAGKVLDWALMFENDPSVVRFLDQARLRYDLYPDALVPFPARRYMRFPTHRLPDIPDSGRVIRFADRHANGRRCPARPALEAGTLVGRVIGRALDSDGKPVADTLKQEHYMEARFEVPVRAQQALVEALDRAGDRRFAVPVEMARALVTHAYLGQLDVNPIGSQPGGRNLHRRIELHAVPVDSDDPGISRLRIEGESDVAGGHLVRPTPPRQSEGRNWEHRVTLTWQGYIDVDRKTRRVRHLVLLAGGDEKLRWGNRSLKTSGEAAVAHLPAGHPIDLECGVRYGLVARPCPPGEIVGH